MGSLLNFVFLKDTHEYNGDETYAMCGPIFYYIVKNEYSYTLNGQLKPNHKNILLIEGRTKLESLLNIPEIVYNFIKNNDNKTIINKYTAALLHTSIYIYMYMYMYVCMYV